MTLMELKEHIAKSNNVDGIYIFTGDETVILKAYVDKLIKKSKYEIMNYTSVKQVYQQLKSSSLLFKNNYVYIVRDDKEFISWSDTEWEKVNNPKLIKNNVIILIYDNIPKNSKFYKFFAKAITIFDRLNEDILTKYVLKELPGLDIKYAKELSNICEFSYSRILLECDKLRHLGQALNLNSNNCYIYAMKNSFIYIPPEDAIFSLVNSCLERNIDDCYYYLNECKKIEENELNILSNLYNKFRVLLQVQSVGYNKDICDITGLEFYQVKQVNNYVNKYSIEELFRALRLIHYCELSIKQGTMEASDTIDFMLVNLF